jgi:carboxyl-terminal processing protease
MWSVAADAPMGAAIRVAAAELLAEIQAETGSGPCRAADALGGHLATWARQLRTLLDEGYREGLAAPPPADPWPRISSTPFEDGRVTRGARELARALGRDLGMLRAVYGDSVASFVDAARDRAAPLYGADAWGRVVVAAAVRAYVPQLDAHGAWAPLDEEISIYDLGLEVSPPPRLWTEMTRTAIGVRIDHGAVPPLLDGDLVLRTNEVPLGCVSVEQAEQLSVLPERGNATRVAVLRRGLHAPIDIAVSAPPPVTKAPEAVELALDLVRYAEAQAAVITIPDVPDDLGARLSAALDRARAGGELRGVLLDVRANGGGSTDGAVAALGLFLPGASLFPMRRRDGAVEVERAPEVPADKRYGGPLAVLVDGDSASAAEMIAGAVASYRRGLVIGTRTYGKGCAQEYLDDDAHAGVLRLTTLLFALPDGTPVQKVGVVPQLRIELPAASEREALTQHALGPWRGPDVRDPGMVREVAWPSHGGRVGPCRDDASCRALRALGAAPAAAR